MSLAEFKAKGKRAFTERVYDRLCQQIEDVRLDCEFLVCGFDASSKPHIFSVADPGLPKSHDIMGYWAIGSGQWAALGALMVRSFSAAMDLPPSLYCLSEAKFLAEGASGVGKETIITVLRSDQSGVFLAHDNVDKIRAIWNQSGKPTIPMDAVLGIIPLIKWQDFTRQA